MKKEKWSSTEIEILCNFYLLSTKNEMSQLLPDRSYEAIVAQAHRLNIIKIENWSNEEIELLGKYYQSSSWKELLCLFPKRARASIYTKASSLGLSRQSKWTEEEDNIIRNNYNKVTVSNLCKILPSRTKGAIRFRGALLGLKSFREGTWTQEERNLVKKYYLSDYEYLCECLSYRSQERINRIANEMGLIRRFDLWTKEEDDIIRFYYPKTRPRNMLIYLPDRTTNAIKNRAKLLGVKVKNFSERCRIYSHNDTYFSVIDNNRAYFAGLLAADGWVSNKKHIVGICLKQEDGYLLDCFASEVAYSGKVNYGSKMISGKEFQFAELRISSAFQLVEDLYQNYNITPAKSLTLQPPQGLSGSQKLSFIRGLIDGDGGITLHQNRYIRLKITGTAALMEWVKVTLDNVVQSEDIGNLYYPSYAKCCVYHTSGTRAHQILSVLQGVLVPVYMKRKWAKIQQYEQLRGITCVTPTSNLAESQILTVGIT